MKASTISAVMRYIRSKRTTKPTGRPRTNAKRCPCGAMTVKCAAARCHYCVAPKKKKRRKA